MSLGGQKSESPTGDADGLSGSEFSQRLNRYGTARARALEQAEYIARCACRRHSGLGHRIERCADYLLFRHYFTVDELRLHAVRCCQLHLLCPFCAIRRGVKALQAYLERWQVIHEANPELRPYMVTLTVRDGADLGERMLHLRSAHRKLWKRRTGTRQVSVVRAVAGAVWSYEVKIGKGSGQWHPHVHGVWLAQRQPDAFALSAEWRGLTGDSFIVDVRPIEGDPVDGFLEVFKYALKFGDMAPADTMHAYETLRGSRLVDSCGAFRGVQVPDKLTDEPLEGLPYVERFYRFLGGSGYVRDRSCESGGVQGLQTAA